jgi:hypothetical protein
VLLLTNRVHAARARRPRKVISDVRADLADAAAGRVIDNPGHVISIASTFRADKAVWLEPPGAVSVHRKARLAKGPQGAASKSSGKSSSKASASKGRRRRAPASKSSAAKSSASKSTAKKPLPRPAPRAAPQDHVSQVVRKESRLTFRFRSLPACSERRPPPIFRTSSDGAMMTDQAALSARCGTPYTTPRRDGASPPVARSRVAREARLKATVLRDASFRGRRWRSGRRDARNESRESTGDEDALSEDQVKLALRR